MAKPSKLWRLVPQQPALRESLSRDIGVSPVMAQVLINRGINDAEEARLFLGGGPETMGDPLALKGMDTAVSRIKHAINSKEKIVIYGDYDVDGVSATALLVRLLGRLGAEAGYYIPERQSEGYGLNSAALAQLAASGARLVITVDCGISAAAEISEIGGKLDIIVTDHHQPPDILPPALAVINPKQPGCPYPEKNLAGVGVAFKLCQALWREFNGPGARFAEYLDIVALGTVADIVPLAGENRTLVRLGLEQLAATANPGLRALIKVAGLEGAKIDAGRVGFALAPRLNAAGRIAHAAAGVELLLTEDTQRAEELAQLLDRENARRQTLEKELLAAAEEQLAGLDATAEKVLVLAGEGWHPGVIGIVASRLVDRYYRPVVMISLKDGVGKGSCRSIPGFDIFRALEECADILIQFGGHQQAAGLSINADNIGGLRRRLGAIAGRLLSAEDYRPVLNIDSRVALDEINAAFLEQLAGLAPYGMGNPCPVFVCEELELAAARAIGQDGRHLKLKVRRSGASGDVIAWDRGAQAAELESAGSLDVAFYPEFNDWQGQRTIQLKAHDVRASQCFSPLKLVDVRNTADKVSYIKGLAEAGQALLIRVADRRRAAGLAAALRRAMPGRSCLIALCRRGEGGAGAAKARLTAGRGEPALLISAAAPEETGPWPGDTIFYDPPLSAGELGHAAAVAAERGRALHLLYGPDDIQYVLHAKFPGREAFGWIYLTLRELAGDAPVSLSGRRLAALARRRSGLPLDETAVSAALETFSQLELINVSGAAGRQTVAMKPAPAEKLSLDAAPAYRDLAAARDAYAALAAGLLQKPAGEIRRQCLAKPD